MREPSKRLLRRLRNEADHLTKLALGDEEAGADPALDLIARPPALYIPADRLHDGERRLDHVGARQAAAELIRYPQLVNGECLLQPFFQAARRARIQVHQLAMELVECAL